MMDRLRKVFISPGIQVRLMVTAFFLISSTTFFMGYMAVKTVNKSVQTRFEERIRFFSKYLAMNAELGILIDERAILQRLAVSLIDEKDLARVVIENSAGNVLADASKKMNGPFRTEIRVVIQRDMSEENDAFLTGIIKDADPVLGRVKIVYSTWGIQELLSTMTRWFVLMSIALVFISVIIFYFISHSIVAPVDRLVRVATEVSHGDYEIRVKPGSLPEARELALAFNEMLDSIESSRYALQDAYRRMSRQKTLAEVGKFSMMIAHEVKNPLSIIRSSFDLLKKDFDIPQDNLMKEYIEDEMVRLNRLIEDFLLFARPSKPRFSKVDLNGMMHDLIARFEIQAGSDQIRFDTQIPDRPFWGLADLDLLLRAVGNILKNAWDAHQEEGVIEILVEQRNRMWHLEVTDYGPGIPDKDLANIFEPFFTTKASGTGLGLAFVLHVVKAHEGFLSAQNVKGKGASFVMELPEYEDHI